MKQYNVPTMYKSDQFLVMKMSKNRLEVGMYYGETERSINDLCGA